MSEPVLTARNVTVELTNGQPIVERVSFALGRGEMLGLVGESGSGKTTVALALLGYHKPGVRITGGSVQVNGQELLGRPEGELRKLRGRQVAYVPQDPSTSLTPSLRVGDQIRELLEAHLPGNTTEETVHDLLRRVHLPGGREFERRFVHQLSGGQQQRLAIALALSCGPPVLVLDEPTTGLDVLTQASILREIVRLCSDGDMSAVIVSHDLAVVSTVADRLAVMYAGLVVEEGPAASTIQSPRHPYTRGLICSVPDHRAPHRLIGIPGVAVGVGDRPPGCPFAPRCPQRIPQCDQAVPPLAPVSSARRLVRCFAHEKTPPVARVRRDPRDEVSDIRSLLKVEDLNAVHSTRRRTVTAVSAVSFTVNPRECLALVGESGSGKTTIARCIAGLHVPSSGRLVFDGYVLDHHARHRPNEIRRRLQIVFQNPYDSLNPTHTVRQAVARPLRLFMEMDRKQAGVEVDGLLDRVRLPPRLADRYPAELSGGERQRVAIARALATKPELLVCDEITSSLDVSIQAAVLDLLADLRRELQLGILFITHDLGVVASVADNVLVLQAGSICEAGRVDDLLAHPSDEYTRRLIAAAPTLDDSHPQLEPGMASLRTGGSRGRPDPGVRGGEQP